MPSIGYFNRANDYKRLHVSNSMLEFMLEHTDGPIKQMFLDIWFGDCDARTFSDGLELHRTADVVPANYLSVRKGDEPLISFVPYNKVDELGEDVWKRAGRQTARPGRMLRSLFRKEFLDARNIGDAELEAFANRLKNYCKIDIDFTLVEGEAIREWYLDQRYDTSARGGSLNGSCMRYDYCQAYLDLYVHCAKMLIATNGDHKLIGRALVWNNVTLRPYTRRGEAGEARTVTLMDRVYYTEDSLQELFFTYAEGQGWYRKRAQNYSDKLGVISPTGEKFEADMEVATGLTKRLKKYPYVDTFSYMRANEWGTLFNTQQEGAVEMSSTDGALINDHSDMVLTDLDGWVRTRYVVRCEGCGRSGSADNIGVARFYDSNGQIARHAYCSNCLQDYILTHDTSTYIRKADAVAAIVGMSYRNSPTIGYFAQGSTSLRHSRHHNTLIYVPNGVIIQTAQGEDIIVRGGADITYSLTLDGYILTADAVWDSAAGTYTLRGASAPNGDSTPVATPMTAATVRGGRSAR